MEEIVPGYNEYKESLFEKIMPILDDYMMAKLKIQQLRKSQQASTSRYKSDAINDLESNCLNAKDAIAEVLLNHP